MHEVSIVQSLLARVAVETERYQARAVVHIHVKLGELAGVDPTLLASAFDLCRAGVAADAELVVTSEPALWRCGRCGVDLERGARLTCPTCGGFARLVAGDSLLLERIEMDVPEQVEEAADAVSGATRAAAAGPDLAAGRMVGPAPDA